MDRDTVIALAREATQEEKHMTKLEAWQAWCTTAGTEDLATEFTLENSSHGKAFSFAWDAAVKAEREACAEIAKQWDIDHSSTNYGGCIAAAIRSRT